MVERAILGQVEGIREKERLSFGVALVIVGIDPSRNGENITMPKIWTIRERKSKPGTGRKEGQISFPAETKKNGEGLISNMLGAISEFTDDANKAGNSLFFMPGFSIIEEGIQVRGNPADLAILIHEGSLDNSPRPVDQEEVAPNGWMTIRELRMMHPEEIRSFSKDVLSLEESRGLIRKVIAEYMDNPMGRLPLRTMLPKDFSSMRGFYEQREVLPDFVVVPKN